MPTERASKERQAIIAEAQTLAAKIEVLTEELVISKAQVRALRIGYIILAVFFFFFILAGITFGIVIIKVNDTVNHSSQERACIATWADATTLRSNNISKAFLDKEGKLDDLIRTLQTPGKNFQVIFGKALNSYISASNHYDNVVANYPVPVAPKFTCQ